VLRSFVEKKHYKFAASAPDWKEAIRMGCESLEADGSVTADYKESIIASVEKNGPYIVLMPNVAMPHSQDGAAGVNKTSVSFMKLEKPVSFDENDPEKDAQLFFTLASANPDEHLANMMKLSEMLMNQDVVDALLTAKTPEDLLQIQEKYLG